MSSMTKKLGLLALTGLFALTLGSAAFAGDNDASAVVAKASAQNHEDRLAAKAMTDDELAEVSAGAYFNWVSVGSSINVLNAGFNGFNGTLVNVQPSIFVLKLKF